MTLGLIRRLGIKAERVNIPVAGLSGSTIYSAKTRARIYLLHSDQNRQLPLYVYGLHNIGVITPLYRIPTTIKHTWNDLLLADDSFDTPNKVDAVLGADAYSAIAMPGMVHRGKLVAQQTIFGWTLSGAVANAQDNSSLLPHTVTVAQTSISVAESEGGSNGQYHEQLVALLQRFWALEEVPQTIRISKQDAECDQIFANEHSRKLDGRYVVPLPLKSDSISYLGESLHNARTTLTSMHKRMQRDPELAESYRRFMQEYAELGHMQLLPPEETLLQGGLVHYIPHHGIWQKSDGGKKLRVVFNASRATTSGKSLNDILHAGPKLQNDIAVVLTRWRFFKFAFCADIKMMFRQIEIDPKYVNLQRIVWSPTPNEPVQHYALKTVTYGTASAPYLSLCVLKQLCIDEGQPLPEAVKAVEDELYIDDFLSGADNIDAALVRRDQLIKLLKAGGCVLKKWVSNEPRLLEDISPEDRLRPTFLQLSTEGPVYELGTAWDPHQDCFKFGSFKESEGYLTKRKVVTELARIFDPVGWLSPLTLTAKFIVQDLWRARLDWDEQLPKPFDRQWLSFRQEISQAHQFTVPRWIQKEETRKIQLHVFADASRRAIAATLYSRTIGSRDEKAVTRLLWAKTKLSPIKSLQPPSKPEPRMTIPRLELRAALLAARLIKYVASALKISHSDCHAWSDSEIVLHWLYSDNPTENSFVDDYIAHIHELAAGIQWHHVPTKENPADLATRKIQASALAESRLWWEGPLWLSENDDLWPPLRTSRFAQPINNNNTRINCLTTNVVPYTAAHPIDKFSKLTPLLRALARARRLLKRKDHSTPIMSPLAPTELRHEFLVLVKLSQQHDFASEIQHLQHGHCAPKSSTIHTLDPFLDSLGILRVGGRLRNSTLPDDEKHPVILHGRNALATLVIGWAHEQSVHGGFRLTYCRAIQRAWIIGGRARVRDYIKKCVVCAIARANPLKQAMASLPSARVTPEPAFLHTGVDYAGPFQVLRSKGRGIRSSKGYIALFVCFSSKAIHLELVGDLTSSSFLGALSRFVNRRGKPAEIWSDNAKCFKGADFELQRLLQDASFDWEKVSSNLAEQGIKWQFIPPSAPHFGGLWEAGVKSVKSHLQRIAGPRNLTYEEFSTLLASIEGVLNSRPLTPITGEIDDLEMLTPAHFLIGRSLISIPEPIAATTIDHATHWSLVKTLRDQFWTRWSKEYLNTLQQRSKWTRPRANLRVGDVVIIIDPALLKSNGRWPLGRVIEARPGSDNLVRVATVRTETSTYTRPITKLAYLPVNHSDLRQSNEKTTNSSSQSTSANNVAGGEC